MKKCILRTAALCASAALLGTMLVSCGSSGSSAGDSSAAEAADTSSVPDTAPETAKYDTTVFSAEAPSDWGLVPFPDTLDSFEGDNNPYSLYAIKGGTTGTDVLRCPYIWITYYPEAGRFIESKSFYEDIKDIEPYTAGSRTWEGYSFKSSGIPGIFLKCAEGEGTLTVMISPERDSDKISLDDEAVKNIIASIAID